MYLTHVIYTDGVYGAWTKQVRTLSIYSLIPDLLFFPKRFQCVTLTPFRSKIFAQRTEDRFSSYVCRLKGPFEFCPFLPSTVSWTPVPRTRWGPILYSESFLTLQWTVVWCTWRTKTGVPPRCTPEGSCGGVGVHREGTPV